VVGRGGGFSAKAEIPGAVETGGSNQRSIRIEALALNSTIVKVHPDGTGALKNRPPVIGKSRGGWTNKIHLVAADAQTAITHPG
jgi:hypothetical protein